MTDTTKPQEGAAPEPLWTNEAIMRAVMMTTLSDSCNEMYKMRDEYEAKIANLQAAYDLRGVHLEAAHDRIATLENAIVVSGETTGDES